MPLFDTFTNVDGSLSIQVKTGPCELLLFKVGDEIAPGLFDDGIIVCPDGYVVIENQIVASVTTEFPNGFDNLPCVTKWGEPFDPRLENVEDYNPLGRKLLSEVLTNLRLAKGSEKA